MDRNSASMLAPDSRYDIICVELADVGRRMRVFNQEERKELLQRLWQANGFCWGCCAEYTNPITKSCTTCEAAE